MLKFDFILINYFVCDQDIGGKMSTLFVVVGNIREFMLHLTCV